MSSGTKVWGTIGVIMSLAALYFTFFSPPRTITGAFWQGYFSGMGGATIGLALAEALLDKDDER